MSGLSVDEKASGRAAEVGKRVRGAIPPVIEIGVLALALIVIGGIYISSYFPSRPPLVLPEILVALAILMVAFNVASIILAKEFAKDTFVKVGRWALLAYTVAAGMLEYVFIYDGAEGDVLILLTLMLIVFAVDVPMIIAFTVAMFQSPRSKTFE